MTRYHCLNGEMLPAEQAKIHASDLAFARGYAAFDFFRTCAGTPMFLEDHLERFETSAGLLNLELPLSVADLKAQILALNAANGVDAAGIKLYLTGGYAEDGFSPTAPNLLILQVPLPAYPPAYYAEGVALITHRHQREIPAAKTTNYLTAVAQYRRTQAAGAVDVLYHDGRNVLETTRANVFLVTPDDVLVTPGANILGGVTRKQLLRVAEEYFPVEVRDVALDELKSAKELFITSTTKAVMPVVRVDADTLGTGKPGRVSRRLSHLFEEHVGTYVAATA